jgi:sterol desaturase/sphingolipid hydroxylase (fatty acid hydroxylase superfamily)
LLYAEVADREGPRIPQPSRVLGALFQPLWMATVLALGFEWRELPGVTPLLVWSAFALLFALERGTGRRSAAEPSWRETLGDLSYKLWGVLLIDPVLRPVLGAASAAAAGLRAQFGFEPWPSAWPLLARVGLSWLAVDLLLYGFQQLQHDSQLLWRTRATHHSSVAMRASATFVNHPIELACLFALHALPAALLGAGAEEISGAALLSISVELFAHSSLGLPQCPSGWLFTTSAYHTRHHSLRVDESSTNFGCALIVWDRLFGTFGGGAPAERLGIGSGARITLAQQLWLPFRTR